MVAHWRNTMYTDPAQWQHVPTEQNPADLCSRGTGPVELAESPLWWDGPQWMSKSKSEWPKMQLADSPTIMPEMRTGKKQKKEFTAYVSLQTNQPQDSTKPCQTATTTGWRLDRKRFSSWSRLVRFYASNLSVETSSPSGVDTGQCLFVRVA